MTPWAEYLDGNRIVLQVQKRGMQIAVRASGPERVALDQLGLDVKVERSLVSYLVTPITLNVALAVLPPGAAEWLVALLPTWRDWYETEQALVLSRAPRRSLLSCSSRLALPDLVSRAPYDEWHSALPADHPVHRLWPYQSLGAWWLAQADGRAILGDDMGLGKTAQVLCYADLESRIRRVVAVVPAAVVWNWTREGAMWAPSLIPRVVKSAKDAPRAVSDLAQMDRGLLVVSWGLLHRILPHLVAAKADLVIVDEAHRMKEADTLRTRAALVLAHISQRRVLLTGTYLRSRYRELWTLLHAVAPLDFPTFKPFGEEFCDPRDIDVGGRTVRIYEGSRRPQALLRVTLPWIVRREKLEVLKDLPPKRRQKLHLEAPKDLVERTRALYDALKDTPEDKIAGSGALVEIGRLWQDAGEAKVPPSIEWIEDAVAQGESVVVFLYHRKVHALLVQGLDNLGIAHVAVVGDMSPKQKDTAVGRFMSGEVPVLIGSDAAKEGLNLVRASMSLHVERWWVPNDEEQAEDRLFRPGQKNPVLNVYPHLHGSLDDYVDRVGARKRALVSAATQPGSLPALLRAVLLEEIRG